MKLLVLLGLVALTTAHFEYTQEFQEWMTKYDRKYETKDVQLQRQIIWESNKKFVENHNANADKFGFTVTMNEYADLDAAEFANIYNGLLPRPTNHTSTNVFKSNPGLQVPSSVDWRQKGAVTEVKNQGKCGGCWAFSATGSLEGQHFRKTGNLVSLSEQQLMDCSSSYGNHGCKGGNMDNAFKYIEKYGLESEEDYPFTAENGICRYDASKVVATCSSYTDVHRDDEQALMEAVAEIGPISVAIDAGHTSFQLYHSGVYYNPTCSSTKLDHGVLAVGYGTYEGEEYWLVKNSWGPRWGMEGYVMMSRDKMNNCGISTMASYPTGVTMKNI